MVIQFVDKFPTLTNNRNWQFGSSWGQLDISHYDNPGLYVSYSYANVKIENSQIQDFTGTTFPNTIYPNISYVPRCY